MNLHAFFANRYLLLVIGIATLFFASCNENDKEVCYPIEQIPFANVEVTDNFWRPKMKINEEVTIPVSMSQLELAGILQNFRVAAGIDAGEFQGEMVYSDSYVYKIIEAASYLLQTSPNQALDAKLDTWIDIIGKAQEPDGYLFTNLTIAKRNETKPHEWVGNDRWGKVHDLSHELYNFGHLFEAAVAHYQATGKRNLLDIAIKAADLLDHKFGWGKLEDYPGHQEVELGLVKMYNVTKDVRYLDLAKFFLDVRGPNGADYCQANSKVVDQRTAIGHAVRATYMYAAMTDIAALYHDELYRNAIHAIWTDMVEGKTYITGGIGASGNNEGFDKPYDLPNMSAYCETCSSVGNMLWNYRMFMLEGESKYIDMMERTLYNAFLSGMSVSGDRYFYYNTLESAGQHRRNEWIGPSCCATNFARTLQTIPEYIYAKTENSLYVNLYIANKAHFQIKDEEIELEQKTDNPWGGKVEITLNPADKVRFQLKLRIPGWAQNQAISGDLYRFMDKIKVDVSVKLNGKSIPLKVEHGYAIIDRKWKAGDVVTLELPMEPRKLVANENIKADRDKMAIQYGPLLYVAERPDVIEEKVLHLVFDKDQNLTCEKIPDLLGGVMAVKALARPLQALTDGDIDEGKQEEIKLIPYYAWNNRGAGEMTLWLPTNEKSAKPLPPPTIASQSVVSGSLVKNNLTALNDLHQPERSNDNTWPFYHWWPKTNAWEWLQYDFKRDETVSSSKVYWFDDGPFGGCRIPAAWELQYKLGEKWVPVKAKSPYKISKDAWDIIEFAPVTTTAMRLRVKLPERFSTGIHEWALQ